MNDTSPLPIITLPEGATYIPGIPGAPHVYVAINAVQAELVAIGIPKDRENKDQGFMFRSIDAVYAALSPLLVKHKLLMLPQGEESDQVERATKSGSAKFCTRVTFIYKFVSAVDGSSDTVKVFGEGMDMADKSTAKAMSQSYKYAAILAFGIPLVGEPDTDDDDGGDPTIAGTATRGSAMRSEPAPDHAPKPRGALSAAMQGVSVPPEEQQKLRLLGKSLIDLYNDEQADMTRDNAWRIWELVEPLEMDSLLWLTNYLKPHSKVRTRVREVQDKYQAQKRAEGGDTSTVFDDLPRSGAQG